MKLQMNCQTSAFFFNWMLGNTASVLLGRACPGLVLALDWRADCTLTNG